MPARIELKTIVRTLYDRLWSTTKDDKVILHRDEFTTAILRAGLLADKTAIRTKWLMLPGFGAYTSTGNPRIFLPHQTLQDLYLVDLLALRLDLGITTPKAGDYIMGADQ